MKQKKYVQQALGKVSKNSLIIEYHFRNKKSIMFIVTLTILLLDSGVCIPLNKRIELNLKSKVKLQKRKYEPEQILRLLDR